MLTKDLLRVSRRGGGYQPQFADEDDETIAAQVVGCYQGHVGKRREQLQEALTDIEHESADFKLVRGLAKLLDREATFETQAAVGPRRAREAAFRASAAIGVVTDEERREALTTASDRLDVTVEEIEQSLYADLDSRQILVAVDTRWNPAELVAQYNLSLAQTALFDATTVRIRSSDPKAVVSAVKRLRLLYEVRRLPDDQRRTVAAADREIVVTGPDALFTNTRRYGTRFARLLRTVAKTADWRVDATIDDRGTERELTLTDDDISVPGVDPVTEVTYDSGVEESFARRFTALELDWDLVREPDAIAAGEHVVIPDFAFDWQHGEFRVYFEIMGFWTPEYVEKKLSRLADIEDVQFLVAVDESLGVGEAIEARDHRAIPYAGSVRVKDVRDALRQYEDELVADAAARLPDELSPDADVVTLNALADSHGVSADALADKSFPDHDQIGRTLVRPAVLADLADAIEARMTVDEATAVIEDAGIDDASATLSALGYRVEWEGLGEGVVRAK